MVTVLYYYYNNNNYYYYCHNHYCYSNRHTPTGSNYMHADRIHACKAKHNRQL